jgi:hypothetical protein
MSVSFDRTRMKGVGRVAFIARLAEITAELDAGWPIKAVYEARKEQLSMSYAQFARYVDQIVRRSRRAQAPGGASPAPSKPEQPIPAAPRPPAAITVIGETTHAGHRLARTFSHDPVEGPDDRKRLLGEE